MPFPCFLNSNFGCIRVDWAKRMWELVQAETSRRTSPLDMDVANALCIECRRWGEEEPFERGNLERKTPYQVLTIWILYTKIIIRRSGTGRVVGVMDGSIHERTDGVTCSRRYGIPSCA